MRVNERTLHHEIKKMSSADKKKLGKELMKEVEQEEMGIELKHPFQESDFENPLLRPVCVYRVPREEHRAVTNKTKT